MESKIEILREAMKQNPNKRQRVCNDDDDKDEYVPGMLLHAEREELIVSY